MRREGEGCVGCGNSDGYGIRRRKTITDNDNDLRVRMCGEGYVSFVNGGNNFGTWVLRLLLLPGTMTIRGLLPLHRMYIEVFFSFGRCIYTTLSFSLFDIRFCHVTIS